MLNELARQYDFSNISVMVAEHHTYMRQTMRSILRTFNIGEIHEAGTPSYAWELYCKARPDVVFADWAPGFDGMTLLKRIRRDKHSPNAYVPVIIVTSLTEQDHVLTARDLGMTEFIAKPFSPKLIFLRLASVAETPRAFIRTEGFFGPDRRRRRLPNNPDRRETTEQPGDLPVERTDDREPA
jgi:two-component system chemotaxis response regulator CheY